MSKITELVWQMAEPVAQRNGCTVWDVEFVKEAGERFLRVYIDSDEGVDITQCEAVSRELDPMLDEADPIDEAYTFEVSSAGAERELKRPGDFEKFIGSYVAVKLYSAKDGHKEHLGTLTGYSEENGVEIDCTAREHVEAWQNLVRELAPREVMMYTIDRETPAKNLQKVTVEQMEAIAKPLVDEGFKIQIRG